MTLMLLVPEKVFVSEFFLKVSSFVCNVDELRKSYDGLCEKSVVSRVGDAASVNKGVYVNLLHPVLNAAVVRLFVLLSRIDKLPSCELLLDDFNSSLLVMRTALGCFRDSSSFSLAGGVIVL